MATSPATTTAARRSTTRSTRRPASPGRPGPRNLGVPFNHLLPAWDAITGTLAATGVLAAERHRGADGGGAARRRGALRRRLRDGRQPRQDRRGPALPARAPEGGQLPLRRLRPGLPDQGRPAGDGRRADPAPVEGAGRRDRAAGGLRAGRATDGRRPLQGGRSLRRPRGARGDPEAVDDHATRWPRSARSSTATASAGARTRRSCSWSTRTRAARPRTRCSTRSSSPGSAPT